MRFNVKNVYSQFDFEIVGASYMGDPKDNTVMYVSKKVEYLVAALKGHKNCLVFAETGIELEEEILKDNAFVFTNNPQLEYARFATILDKERRKENANRKYTLTDGGYYLGENVTIGENAYIEPGCFIGHDVVIGDNATILAGAVIKYAVIGNDFWCNENAVIGDYSFTMAEDENGNKIRIPALGRVVIGNNVEIGPCNAIECGACGDTILEDNVKLDVLICLGHESHLHKNVELTGGTIVGGFVEMGEHTFVGLNACIKNRKKLGANSTIGMGATVTKNVEENDVVVGNPAKPLQK